MSALLGMMLAACNITINGPEDKSNKTDKIVSVKDEAETDQEEEDEEVDDGEGTEKPDESEDEAVGEETPLDLEAVFIKMKEASKTIDRVLVTIDSKTTTTMGGVTSVETSTLVGKLQVDPAIDHVVQTVTSGDGTNSEMYLTEEALYMYTDEFDGWVKFINMQNAGVIAVLKEKQLDHFITYKDQFALTEDDKHFIITYIGSDEMYEEVFSGSPMQIEAIAGSLMEEIEKVEVTGTLTMTVSKDTYLVVTQESTTNATSNYMIEIHQIDENTHIYTNYNDIEEVFVPEDVIKNAMLITP